MYIDLEIGLELLLEIELGIGLIMNLEIGLGLLLEIELGLLFKLLLKLLEGLLLLVLLPGEIYFREYIFIEVKLLPHTPPLTKPIPIPPSRPNDFKHIAIDY